MMEFLLRLSAAIFLFFVLTPFFIGYLLKTVCWAFMGGWNFAKSILNSKLLK